MHYSAVLILSCDGQSKRVIVGIDIKVHTGVVDVLQDTNGCICARVCISDNYTREIGESTYYCCIKYLICWKAVSTLGHFRTEWKREPPKNTPVVFLSAQKRQKMCWIKRNDPRTNAIGLTSSSVRRSRELGTGMLLVTNTV